METRDALQPYRNTRIVIEGTVTMFSGFRDWKKGGIWVPSVCLADIELNGQIVTTHAWLNQASVLIATGCEVGDVIQAKCMVTRYTSFDKNDRNRQFVRYSFRDPRDVAVVNPRNGF